MTHRLMKAQEELLIEPSADGIAVAAELIKTGKLVAFPTETVYGLGANALDADAVRSIFVAKGRPLTDPLIVHVCDVSQALELVDLDLKETSIFVTLAMEYWPGPLTLISKASSRIPPAVTAQTGFVGIRSPSHPIARNLIMESGLPIAAPSANRFGHVSPTKALHVLFDLAEKGVRVLNGEAAMSTETSRESFLTCEYGIESTVLKIDGENNRLVILRQGAITQRQLEETVRRQQLGVEVISLLRKVNMHDDTSCSSGEIHEGQGQEAPGQAITHYAPDVPCYIVNSVTVQGDQQTIVSSAPEDIYPVLNMTQSNFEASCVLIDYNSSLQTLSSGMKTLAYRDLSPSGDSSEAARNLFDTLRWAETAARMVFLPAIDVSTNSMGEKDMRLGLADRIFRAASGKTVDIVLTTNKPEPVQQEKSSLNLLQEVRDSNAFVCSVAQHVAISSENIRKTARELITSNEDNKAVNFLKDNAVEWDAMGWHYCADVDSNGPLTVQYIFVLDAMNFCFWPSKSFEYDTLAMSLKRVLETDPCAFDADKLAVITEETVTNWFPVENPIPNVSERVRRLRELGIVLKEDFNGLAANLVARADKSVMKLVKLVLMYLPGFRDTVVYKGRLIHFYKRAQILVGDLWAAYGRPRSPSHPFYFSDLEQLTMFADYRVPQILRSQGILQYSVSLAKRIDSFEQIPFGSDEETEIRAATVMAVEMLQAELMNLGVNLLVLEVDWLLWQIGEAAKDTISPHHRTLTIYY